MQRSSAPSFRTMAIGLLGLVLMAVVRTIVVLDFGGVFGSAVAVNVGETVLSIVAAIVATGVAVRRGLHWVTGRAWALLGAAIALYAVGNVVWDWMELALHGSIPYPGPPDYFYVAAYLLFAAALLGSLGVFRDLADVRAALGISFTMGIVTFGLLYAAILEPYVLSPPGIPAIERALSMFYTAADVLLLAVPAMALILVLYRLNAVQPALSWGFVCGGTLLLAASDTAFALMSAAGTYVEGGPVNYGWMAAHLAFAIGASLALDAPGSHSRSETLVGAGAASRQGV